MPKGVIKVFSSTKNCTFLVFMQHRKPYSERRVEYSSKRINVDNFIHVFDLCFVIPFHPSSHTTIERVLKAMWMEYALLLSANLSPFFILSCMQMIINGTFSFTVTFHRGVVSHRIVSCCEFALSQICDREIWSETMLNKTHTAPFRMDILLLMRSNRGRRIFLLQPNNTCSVQINAFLARSLHRPLARSFAYLLALLIFRFMLL